MAKDYRDHRISPSAVAYVEKLNLPKLKKECIIRGIPFEEVSGSIPALQTWFLNNYDNPIDKKKLDQYDEWSTQLLKGRNADPSLTDPAFRLGTVLQTGEAGEILKKRRFRSSIPKIRKKKERTSDGLYIGTKKAYTYELQKQGLTKAEVIEKVLEKYPDAKEKSIGIWYNKCRRTHKK